MWQLRSLMLVGTILAGMGQSVRSEEHLPPGAVSRLGTSRFLNYGRVFSLAFSPDGKSLVAGCWDGTVRLWDVAGGTELLQFSKQPGAVRAVAFSPDGKQVAFASKRSEIVLADVATGNEVRRLVGHKAPVTFVTYSPDGNLLASKSYDRSLRLWDLASGKEVRRLVSPKSAKQGQEPDSPVGFSPGGTTAASACGTDDAFLAGNQRTFRRWDVATGAEIRSFSVDRSVYGSAAFPADSGLLAAIAGWPEPRAYIRLWDMDSGKELRPIELNRPPSVDPMAALAFSPDGKTVATSATGPFIELWEVATRSEIGRFQPPDNGRACLAFSPDSRLLAAGSTDSTVLLWDVTGRREGTQLRSGRLSPQELPSLWDDLRSLDAPKGRRALWTLVAGGGPSVALLASRLQPAVSPANSDTIARLVADLESPRYSVRTETATRLGELGAFAEPALVDALKNRPSLELRQRIEQLLNKATEERFSPSGEHLRQVRAVEVLEQIGTPEARHVLETLARGAPRALLTREATASLARLGRQAAAHP
jgi:WD40 repeat protein